MTTATPTELAILRSGGASTDVALQLASITATEDEAEAGEINTKFMTPLRTDQQITARIATETDALNGTDDERLMTPLKTAEAISTAQFASIPGQIADQATAEAGTDNTKFVTPLRVAQEIIAKVPAQTGGTVHQVLEKKSSTAADYAWTGVSSLYATPNSGANGEVARPFYNILGDTISLKSFGTEGGVSSSATTALANALTWLVNSNGTLLLPGGDFYIDSIASVSGVVATDAGNPKRFAIKGAGKGASRIICSSVNAVGGISVAFTGGGDKYFEGVFEDFAIVSDGATKSGAALKITSASTTAQIRNATINRVAVYGTDITIPAFTTAMIDVSNLNHPLVTDVYLVNASDDVDFSDSSINYVCGKGINFDGSYAWELLSAQILGAGLAVSNIGTAEEYFVVRNFILSKCKTAIKPTRSSGRQPLFIIDSGQCHYRDYGIYMTGSREGRITNVQFASAAASASGMVTYPCDIFLENYEEMIITNSEHHGNNETPANRVNIWLSELGTLADGCKIIGGDFMTRNTTGMGSAALTAIRNGDGCKRTRVLWPTIEYSYYTTPIDDQSSTDNRSSAMLLFQDDGPVNTSSKVLALRGASPTATRGPSLATWRASASPANADIIGTLDFYGRNDAAADILYATAEGRIDSKAAGSEGGGLDLYAITGGVKTLVLATSGTGISTSKTLTFNAGGKIDVDSSTTTAAGTGGTSTATLSKMAGVITTDAITTAAGAAHVMTITNTLAASGDLVLLTRMGGTNTRKNYALDAVTGASTITVTISNNEPANAVNGTIIYAFLLLKS
jgi:hypothetical protein